MRRGAIALTMRPVFKTSVFKPLPAEVTSKRDWLQDATVNRNLLTQKAKASAQQSNEPRSRSARLCRIPRTTQGGDCTREHCRSLQEE